MRQRRVLGAGNSQGSSCAERDERSRLGQHSTGGRPQLTLYRRGGCHLCEDLETTLYELVPAERFTLHRVDIDANPALRQRFDTRVPVLMFGEQLLCEYFLDLEAVRSVLAGYNRQLP